MKKYRIYICDDAKEDIQDLRNTIVYQYKAGSTATKYIQGLLNAIKELKHTAGMYAIKNSRSLLQFGLNVRRINYKKMAIVYTIHNDLVYIHRIIPQSMIAGL